MDSIYRNAQPGERVSLTSSNGFLAGIQAGYNWQWDNIVAGVEADISGADWRAFKNNGDTSSSNGALDSKINLLASVRGRLGWALDDSTLVYATGGLAYVKASLRATNFHDDVSTSINLNDFGGVAGGGVDLRVADNITMGLEGLYYVFNKEDNSLASFNDANAGDKAGLDDIFVLRARVSYNF